MAFLVVVNNVILEEIEEIERMNNLRLERRRIRDDENPFDLPDSYFLKLFRFTRDMARNIIEQLSPHMVENRRSTGIPIHIKILATLNFVAHGCYQKNTGQDFKIGLCQSAISGCIKEVTNVFVDHLMMEHIKFPIRNEDQIVVKQGFARKFNIGGILGCIDGTHVAIQAPRGTDEDYPPAVYYNRKGFYSINVQILCDADLKIMSANARFPGSCHDSAIWTTSAIIRHHLLTQYQNNMRNSWLLGDSGYPLEPWLLTPIENAAPGSPEARYTQHHCLIRNTVERCIGVLKMRFRCLTKTRALVYHPVKAGKIIYSCIILHNLAINFRLENYEDDLELDDADEQILNNLDHGNIAGRGWLIEGRRIRNNFIRTYF